MSQNILSVIIMEKSEKNPYVSLLINALKREEIDITQTDHLIILPLIRSTFQNPSADIIQLDWIYRYYMSDGFSDYKLIDDLITLCRWFAFLFEILVISIIPTSIVWTVHNKHHHERNYARINKITKELMFFLSDSITVKCESAKKELISEYRAAKPEKMYVVPDGNYIPAYENEVSRSDSRSELSINEDAFVYLFFGMIREYKGIPELIAVFQNLDQPTAELWVVGKPNDAAIRMEIERQAKKADDVNTIFEYVDAGDVQYYMNAADVFVLPYRKILNSGSVHLGLSFGLPIVAPQIGCIPEVLPSENELMYSPKQGDGLSNALRDAYNSSNLDQISERNYRCATSNSWDNAAKRLIEVYKTAS